MASINDFAFSLLMHDKLIYMLQANEAECVAITTMASSFSGAGIEFSFEDDEHLNLVRTWLNLESIKHRVNTEALTITVKVGL